MRIGPIISADDSFAYEEREGDQSRADWLREHRAYLQRGSTERGLAINDDAQQQARPGALPLEFR